MENNCSYDCNFDCIIPYDSYDMNLMFLGALTVDQKVSNYRTVKLIGHFACERYILLFDVILIGQFSG